MCVHTSLTAPIAQTTNAFHTHSCYLLRGALNRMGTEIVMVLQLGYYMYGATTWLLHALMEFGACSSTHNSSESFVQIQKIKAFGSMHAHGLHVDFLWLICSALFNGMWFQTNLNPYQSSLQYLHS